MNFVIKPFASCGSLPFSPATVLVSVAVVKFFASLRFAHIRRLEVKVLGVFISHFRFFCDGFSENR
jgi:hypothetical protein